MIRYEIRLNLMNKHYEFNSAYQQKKKKKSFFFFLEKLIKNT